ncbi:ranBP2-type zinc finger protein At1g67325 [Neltuma alba]|uniref:ranBP2-type zinc finger protein At1g67325 n=1 Tax=Neltuma alba TaxID=207710 RepID=UPI0010A38557|nr:ranBP2-type zinc finger protein At1g67325 [Prosopis alba]
MGEGREGDWECSGCNNRNYAFRSFCNRCKQPRLLVDNETPADSKWLPRIGDWICTGCTNNNYASREKCKKCGQPKEVAAMPAVAMTGASFPTYSHHFSRAPGGADQKMNIGLIGNSAPPVSLWLPSGNYGSGLPYDNSANPNLPIPKGWRSGDWICNCGFHNYSSRSQCKKCNAFPPALGTKRLASEELVYDWDNKRLNVGHTIEQQQTYTSVEQVVGASADSKSGVFASATINSSTAPSLPMPMLFPPQITTPALLGKGAKQWRNGDWMCTNCNNHNYASRLQCNRCKTHRMAPIQPVNVM